MPFKEQDSKTLCLAPWMAIHTWPDGKTFPCCLWDSNDPVGNINQSDLSEIWNSEKMKEARVKMLKGEKVKSCSRCYDLENVGHGSYREGINSRHSASFTKIAETNEDGSLDKMELQLWDIRLSNFCNFKCRSCGAELSSSWHSDTIALGGNPEEYPKALINVNDKASFMSMIEPHYKYVEEIYFAGGEPLLMPEHYTILNKLIELGRTDVIIRYSTNFSKLQFGKYHIFDLWKHFSNVQLYISIDGIGKIGEYVRKGFNDNEFDKNIKNLNSSEVVPKEYGFTITYGVLNYLHLFDLILEFLNRGYINGVVNTYNYRPLIFSPIETPEHYDCKFLPDSIKEAFKQRLDGFEQELLSLNCSEYFINDTMFKLNSIYRRSTESEYNKVIMQKCIDITKKLDSIREEKIEDVIPYLKPLDMLVQ